MRINRQRVRRDSGVEGISCGDGVVLGVGVGFKGFLCLWVTVCRSAGMSKSTICFQKLPAIIGTFWSVVDPSKSFPVLFVPHECSPPVESIANALDEQQPAFTIVFP